jgi:hypothetical protein
MSTFKYNCDNCTIHTNSKQSFNRHLLSKRHERLQVTENYPFSCEKCTRKFKSNSGVWRHQTKCTYAPPINTEELHNKIDKVTELILDMKTNQQPITNNNNNTLNQNYNINLILNENFTQAKNFIDMIQNICVEGPYPDKISSENYVAKVFQLIKTEIDKMPIDERPIHCIKDEDERQKILHIRHDNKWETETELEWTSQIHNYYIDDGDEASPEEEKIIFNGLKQLEENIIAEIAKLNNAKTQREYSYETVHPPNKVRIIKCLLDYVNIAKEDILKIIERAYSKKAQTAPIHA